jgi:hypothetical protein
MRSGRLAQVPDGGGPSLQLSIRRLSSEMQTRWISSSIGRRTRDLDDSHSLQRLDRDRMEGLIPIGALAERTSKPPKRLTNEERHYHVRTRHCLGTGPLTEVGWWALSMSPRRLINLEKWMSSLLGELVLGFEEDCIHLQQHNIIVNQHLSNRIDRRSAPSFRTNVRACR